MRTDDARRVVQLQERSRLGPPAPPAGPRGGALGRAFLALLWSFHNSRSGVCFPSYERIAERAGCARSTVAEAIKALEFAGVLTRLLSRKPQYVCAYMR